ncbi:hypothetical protein GCM10008967_11650 [Bacillus carboniphilus]|uniref:Uncharacterized protein n=1 Tax=Bacillus carboniphilus TaxID=86663 RepID=A0ABP3FTJ4_9BACI
MENKIILYKKDLYKIIRINESGYGEVKKLSHPQFTELIHVKDIKDCPVIY